MPDLSEKIKNIELRVQTATQQRGEETVPDSYVDGDGELFLGAAGREFRCLLDSGDDILRAGARDVFVFGGDANVALARANDPQPLTMEEARQRPVYLRYHSGDEDWCVERAEVVFESESGEYKIAAPLLDGEAHVWLGDRMGRKLYLDHKRYRDGDPD
jgi:hypothetical protein